MRVLVPFLMLAISLSPAALAAAPAFHEDWETGGAGWSCATGGPMLVADAFSPDGPTVQEYQTAWAGGDCLSPAFHLDEGAYCLSTWIRWDSGNWPFVGLEPGDQWLIGSQAAYPSVTHVPSDAVGWHWYAAAFTAESGDHQIQTELWSGATKGGDPLGAFDGLDVSSGACPGAAPPVPELGTLALGFAGVAVLGAFVLVRRRA